MNHKRITGYVVVFIFALIAVWDVIAISGGGTEASISHLLIVWSYKYPAFTFSVGFAMGHLFWRVRQTKDLSRIEDVWRGDNGDIPKD